MEECKMNLIKYKNPSVLHPWSAESLFGSSLSELSMIEPLFERLFQGSDPSGRNSVILNESNDAFELKIELPGYSKKDIALEIDKNFLNLSFLQKGSQKEDGVVEAKRSIQLPEDIDAKKTIASLENGILTVNAPKKADRKPLQLKLG